MYSRFIQGRFHKRPYNVRLSPRNCSPPMSSAVAPDPPLFSTLTLPLRPTPLRLRYVSLRFTLLRGSTRLAQKEGGRERLDFVAVQASPTSGSPSRTKSGSDIGGELVSVWFLVSASPTG